MSAEPERREWRMCKWWLFWMSCSFKSRGTRGWGVWVKKTLYKSTQTPEWVNRSVSVRLGAAAGRRSLQNLFIFYWNSTNIYPVRGAHQLLICRLHINSAEIHQETAELINRLGLKDLQLWGLLIYQKRQTIEKSPLPHTWIPRAEPR